VLRYKYRINTAVHRGRMDSPRTRGQVKTGRTGMTITHPPIEVTEARKRESKLVFSHKIIRNETLNF
jgi:hypothetical protein